MNVCIIEVFRVSNGGDYFFKMTVATIINTVKTSANTTTLPTTSVAAVATTSTTMQT